MKKKLLAVFLTAVMVMSMTVSVFAEDGVAVSYSDVKSIIDAITAVFQVKTIVAIIAGVLGSVMVFVFMWWAIRRVARIAMAAIRKGRVST